MATYETFASGGIANLVGRIRSRYDSSIVDGTATGSVAAITCAVAGRALRGATVNGASEQDGTPTPAAPVAIESITAASLCLGEDSTTATSTTAIDLDGHELRSLPDGTCDELTIGSDGSVTLTQRVGSMDMGDLTWARLSSGVFQGQRLTGGAVGTLGTYECLCTGYEGIATQAGSAQMAAQSDKTCALQGNYAYLFVNDSDYTDATAFATAVDGMTLLYPLATPVTYTLPSITMPTVPASTGSAWAQTDPATTVDVTYRQSVQLVIDDLRTQIAALATA